MSTKHSTLSPSATFSPTVPSTVGAVAEAYLSDAMVRRRLAPRTLALREQQLHAHVVPLLGPETELSAVSVKDLRRLIGTLEGAGLGGSAIRSCVSAVSAVFVFAVRVLEVVERNPIRDLERGDLPSARRQSEPRYLSTAEVDRLLNALTPSFRPVAAVLFWAGLRISEALALRWSDIDLQHRALRVPGSKSSASRATVPLADVLASELDLHRQREAAAGRFDKDGLVFQTRSGRSPGRRNAHRAITHAGKKAGLVPAGTEPVGPHDLRHSYAAMLLENGMSIVETSRLLRHGSVSVTAKVYSGITDSALARLGDRLNEITARAAAEPEREPAS